MIPQERALSWYSFIGEFIPASGGIGLADNTLLPLATAAYSAAEKIGMPECRINLAHCAVALCEAPKSTRSYRGLKAAYSALSEPGTAGLPIPIHLRKAAKTLKENFWQNTLVTVYRMSMKHSDPPPPCDGPALTSCV